MRFAVLTGSAAVAAAAAVASKGSGEISGRDGEYGRGWDGTGRSSALTETFWAWCSKQ